MDLPTTGIPKVDAALSLLGALYTLLTVFGLLPEKWRIARFGRQFGANLKSPLVAKKSPKVADK